MKPTYHHYTPTRSSCVQPGRKVQIELPPVCRVLVEDYLAWKQSYTKSAATAYRLWVERFQHFIQKQPEEITVKDVSRFLTYIKPMYAEMNVQFAMNIVHNYLQFYHH